MCVTTRRAVTLCLSPENARRRLQEVYRAHAPEKLSQVDTLLQKYAHDLDGMFAALEKKYQISKSDKENARSDIVPIEPSIPAVVMVDVVAAETARVRLPTCAVACWG